MSHIPDFRDKTQDKKRYDENFDKIKMNKDLKVEQLKSLENFIRHVLKPKNMDQVLNSLNAFSAEGNEKIAEAVKHAKEHN